MNEKPSGAPAVGLWSESSSTAASLSDAAPADADVTYRPFCGLAAAGFVLGLFSWLAFFGPGFWIVPLCGALASYVALRRIRAAPELAGRQWALLGLVLAGLLGGPPIGRHLMRETMQTAQAAATAEAFFRHLAAGELLAAHQLTLRAEDRHPTLDLDEPYQPDTEMQKLLDDFLRNSIVRELTSLPRRDTLRGRPIELIDGSEHRGDAVLNYIYELTWETESEPGSRHVQIVLIRPLDYPAPWAWRINMIPPPANYRPPGQAAEQR